MAAPITGSDRDPEEDVLITEVGVELSRDPLAVMELLILLANIVFEEAGEYRFQLWLGKDASESCVLERRIVVQQVEQ